MSVRVWTKIQKLSRSILTKWIVAERLHNRAAWQLRVRTARFRYSDQHLTLDRARRPWRTQGVNRHRMLFGWISTAAVPCQFQLSGRNLDQAAEGYRQRRVASRRTLSSRRLHRDEHEPPGRARRCFLQQARDVRAMDQGGQRRDQVDATVMPNVRRQRGAAPASCARLQPRQFPADAGDAGADQGLVADDLEGQADQDRRESREPRPLCYLPDGRGRHRTANVPRDFAADRGATAAATTSASVRRSMSCIQEQPTEGVRPNARENGQIRPSNAVRTVWDDGTRPRRHPLLRERGKIAKMHARSGVIRGIPADGVFVLEGQLPCVHDLAHHPPTASSIESSRDASNREASVFGVGGYMLGERLLHRGLQVLPLVVDDTRQARW